MTWFIQIALAFICGVIGAGLPIWLLKKFRYVPALVIVAIWTAFMVFGSMATAQLNAHVAWTEHLSFGATVVGFAATLYFPSKKGKLNGPAS